MIEATPNQLSAWATSANQGDRLVYYVGNLAGDRMPDCARRNPQGYRVAPAAIEADQLADLAWRLHERGVITLVQQRVALDVYRYIAVRTRQAIARPQVAA